MLSRLAGYLNPTRTPQAEPAPGVPQVPNSAGGWGFDLDDWARLDRFLVLGSEGGTYYATERAGTVGNADAVKRCVLADGPRAVARIAELSESGRAPKNTPAVLALALAAEHGDPSTKTRAYRAVPRVCRTGTHLFEFAAAKKALGGAFGAGMRRAVGRWYTDKSPDALAYQVAKYRSRAGFTHRDLLRLARPHGTLEVDAVVRWCVRGADGLGAVTKAPSNTGVLPARSYPASEPVPELLAAFDQVQGQAKRPGGLTAGLAVRAVIEHGLPWECLPSESLTFPEVWDALLPRLPMTALVRNLATMTRAGVLAPGGTGEAVVCERLRDAGRVRKARMHPLAVLLALMTYAAGKGQKSAAVWEPNPAVVAALNDCFYLAFVAVRPTGQRWYLGLDVSGSMGWSYIAGSTLSAREAAVAMALVTLGTEADCTLAAFNSGMVPLPVGRGMRLDAACKGVNGLPFGATDCALPMLDAAARKRPVDVFVVYTDNETWAGAVHPYQALRDYREKTGIGAKLAVVGLTSTGFSIADPGDSGMLDVVGFDAATPGLLGWFAGGAADAPPDD